MNLMGIFLSLISFIFDRLSNPLEYTQESSRIGLRARVRARARARQISSKLTLT